MGTLHLNHTLEANAPCGKVITTGREHFSVYRRNKREFIPLVCPPEKAD